MVPPWILAGFDLAALVLLVTTPVPPAFRGSRQRSRWLCLAIVFCVFGLLSLITMAHYSTMGAIPTLRKDSRLSGEVTIQRVRPSTEDILDLCGKAAGVNLMVDDRLRNHQPDYGVWDLKAMPSWTVMEFLVSRQTVPARWEKTDDGYALVAASPFGKSLVFWLTNAALLLLSMIGLRQRELIKERKKLPFDDSEAERKSVAGLCATRT